MHPTPARIRIAIIVLLSSAFIAVTAFWAMNQMQAEENSEDNTVEVETTAVPTEVMIVPKSDQTVQTSATILAPVGSEHTSYYLAEKIEYTTTVYDVDVATDVRTEVFSFDELHSYDSTSGNTYEGLTPSVDYSPEKDIFVYADEVGIALYYFTLGEATVPQTKYIVQRYDDNEEAEVDGVFPGLWSDDSVTGFGVIEPHFSPDGAYVYFRETQYEGSAIRVYSVEDDTIDPDFSPFGFGEGLAWNTTSENAVTGRKGGYGTNGVMVYDSANGFEETVLAVENFDQAKDFDSPLFIDEDTIAYSIEPGLVDSDGNPVAGESTLEIHTIYKSGNGGRVLIADEYDNRIRYAVDGYIIYEQRDTTNDNEVANSGMLELYSIDSKSTTDIIPIEAGEQYRVEYFDPTGLYVIVVQEKYVDGSDYEEAFAVDIVTGTRTPITESRTESSVTYLPN